MEIIGNAEKIISWLFKQDREKLFEIKERKNKKTLSQNAYAWHLISEIANKMRFSKEEVYKQMLRDYGQSVVISLKADINPAGYVKYFDEIGEGTVNGTVFKHYKAYKGISEFDTKEMSIFIDGVIQDATALEIPTLTHSEIAELRLI